MTIGIVSVPLDRDVGAWFTGRDQDRARGPLRSPGNLAHRRPHRPGDLARDRAEVARTVGYPSSDWHLLRQVHGDQVAVIDEGTPPGAECRDVDAAVTALVDRPLVVQVADCVPVLLSGSGAVGVAHAGREGVRQDVVAAVVAAMSSIGADPASITAAVGPAIGGCCYEVPPDLQRAVTDRVPAALATTTWGTPALDLPAAVTSQLETAGVADVIGLDTCTRCDPGQRWFSHRADPSSGRQVGLVVRTDPSSATDAAEATEAADAVTAAVPTRGGVT